MWRYARRKTLLTAAIVAVFALLHGVSAVETSSPTGDANFTSTLAPLGTEAPEASDDVLIWGLNHSNSVLVRSLLGAGCVLLAGLVSGLTLSIFSITKEELESMAAVFRTQKRAKRLLRLHHHEHWVLVTLLVCNAASVEALPLLLEPMLVNRIVQVLVPTLLVLFFSEISPQSIFVRFAFAVSAALIPFVVVMMIVTAPISFTVGMLLDKIVGHRSLRSFRRMELRQLVYENMARSGLLSSDAMLTSRRSMLSRASGVRGGEDLTLTNDLTRDEARLILGALSISETKVMDRMKPMFQCLWVTPETQFSPAVVEVIAKAGYSRIPVLSRAAGEFNLHTSNRSAASTANPSTPTTTTSPTPGGGGGAPVTFMLAKDLIRLVHQPAQSSTQAGGDAPSPYATPKQFAQFQTVSCSPNESVLDLYLKFLTQKRHLAVVVADDGEPVGIITYSDVIGILTQTQFLDESDLGRELPPDVRLRKGGGGPTTSRHGSVGGAVLFASGSSPNPSGRTARQSAHSSNGVTGERTALLAPATAGLTPPAKHRRSAV